MKWRSLEESEPAVDQRSLRDQFAERKDLIAKYVPAETRAMYARVVADLREGGILDRALSLGAFAPDFELPDQNGKLVSSSNHLSKGPLVICFIRGRWCPFCVGQLEALNSICFEIRKRGASLVAVSPQTVQQSFFMADQHRLQFPLLSDAKNEVARRFGITYRVPDDQQAVYRRAFVNLPFANGDESWTLPIPATYIVNRHSKIIFSSANPDYTDRPEPEAILTELAKS
jgi:peroxiredoxin